MGSEVLIYGYGLVCLSMLAFNLIYSLYLRGAQRAHSGGCSPGALRFACA